MMPANGGKLFIAALIGAVIGLIFGVKIADDRWPEYEEPKEPAVEPKPTEKHFGPNKDQRVDPKEDPRKDAGPKAILKKEDPNAGEIYPITLMDYLDPSYQEYAKITLRYYTPSGQMLGPNNDPLAPMEYVGESFAENFGEEDDTDPDANAIYVRNEIHVADYEVLRLRDEPEEEKPAVVKEEIPVRSKKPYVRKSRRSELTRTDNNGED